MAVFTCNIGCWQYKQPCTGSLTQCRLLLLSDSSGSRQALLLGPVHAGSAQRHGRRSSPTDEVGTELVKSPGLSGTGNTSTI